jgi:DNA-binding NarL/FixJ family response regulator
VQVTVHRFEDEDGDTQLVHVLEPIDQVTRLARAVERLAAATNGRAPEPAAPVPGADEPPLTAREAEVLRLVSEGLQNKEIAHKMGISHATVRNHVHNILEKLGVHSKLEAVSLAFRRGWVASADRRRSGAAS